MNFKDFFFYSFFTYVNLFSLYEFSLKKHLIKGKQHCLAAAQLGISGSLYIEREGVKDCWNYWLTGIILKYEDVIM